jgi:fatty-acid desaturase
LRDRFFKGRPWARSIWRPAPGSASVLAWLVLIHVTAAVGLFLFPIPSLGVGLAAFAVCWLGGIGTTVAYHRALAHRSLRLNGAVRSTLTFFAVLNGSATPIGWVANHRFHHAHSDTVDDVSSPTFGGFWWAHLRWIWQAGAAPRERYCPDLKGGAYKVWDTLQPGILALSYFGGLLFGLEGFFWLGAIRLVFALHGQCFVNSICHMRPVAAEGMTRAATCGGWPYGTSSRERTGTRTIMSSRGRRESAGSSCRSMPDGL